MVLLSALACIQLYEEEVEVASELLLPEDSVVVQVPCNGMCFWACIYLATQASPAELFQWFVQPRNGSGFPSASRAKEEDEKVYLWAMGLKDLFREENAMPLETKQRLKSKESATHVDMVTWLPVATLVFPVPCQSLC